MESKSAPFFLRLFRGDVPLAKTFWIYGVVINALLMLAFITMMYATETSDLSPMTIYSIMGFYVLCIFYQIFILIAIFRSALKYHGHVLFKWLAILAVITGVLYLVMTSFWIFEMVENPIAAVQAEVDDMNERLPIQINDETQLNSVVLHDQAITYDVTILVDPENKQMDVKTFNDLVEKDMKVPLCAGDDTRYLLQKGFSYVFNYKDKQGKSWGQVSISEEDCEE